MMTLINVNQMSPVPWKFSAAWLGKHFDCGTETGFKRCVGACCKSPKYWPVNVQPQADGGCFHLTDTGCQLLMENRPITCLLFPLKFVAKPPFKTGIGWMTESVKIILYGRACIISSTCGINYKKGPTLVSSLAPQLIILLGSENYLTLLEQTLMGIDTIIYPQKHIHTKLVDEIRKIGGNRL